MALGTGANSITVSKALWAALSEHLDANDFHAMAAVKALAKVVQERAGQQPVLQLGIVHPHSAHHYELAYWLASAGLLPGRDVDLIVVPPSLMPAAIASGHIDGFCAGEPWGTVAANDGTGVILTTNAHIWCNSPEKVLGVRSGWAEENPDCLQALVRAIYHAAKWCDELANQDQLAAVLSREDYVGQSIDLVRPCLARRLKTGDGILHPIEGFLHFASNAATFPWTSQALWFYSQMVRWGQVQPSDAAEAVARKTYRPEIYRSALKPLGVEVPSANAKVEGALQSETPVGSTSGHLRLGPDAFFDGRVFDPDRLADYIASFRTDKA